MTATLQAEEFLPIPTLGLPLDQKIRALRMNGFGSLFYLTKIILKRRRLSYSLHLPFCNQLEADYIKDLIEMPRDHFKSTICVEGLPIWWSLPLMQQDLDYFAKLNYSDEFIKWQVRRHNLNRRNCLVSENITNAAKLGSRVRWHFESNALYRACYPETLPTPGQTWTNYSLHVNRGAFGTGASHGEGTFDFLGAGGALQSRHYDGLIQDDLVGRKAIDSPTVMEDTIEYHRLLVGAFDSEDKEHENDELVVGNRWGFHDLNSYIRENETWFRISSHSALGGCCDQHSPDTPIFPEEFSFEKLLKFRARLGAYNFSCQFLNNPIAPEDADFQASWLKYYSTYRDSEGRLTIQHEVQNGEVIKDTKVGHLAIAMAVDPNHSGNAAAGRCRHAIVVVGKIVDEHDNDHYYLLEAWAKHVSYGALVDKIYFFCDKWRLNKFGLETVAAQMYLKFHIDEKNKVSGRKLSIIPLKGEVEAPDGTLTKKKTWRILNVLSPIFERGAFNVNRKHQDFLGEYQTFPRGKYVDLLDALAYVPQMLARTTSAANSMALLARYQQRAKLVGQPYSAAN